LLRNRFAHLDRNDNTFPWVELYTRGSVPVDLAGYSLSNDPKSPGKWKLPQTKLAPGEYWIVWCSGKGRGPRDSSASAANEVHTNFALEEREILVLIAPDGRNADALVLPRQTEDRSYARTPDGSGPFRYHVNPSPASKNDGPSSVRPIPSIPDMHPVGGFYDRRLNIRIQIRLPLDDYEIRYTLDGSTPLPTGIRYSGSVVLLPAPRGASRTIRAAAFYQNQRVSQIQTQSYFMEAPGLTLPVLSISLAPPDFERIQLDLWARGPSSEKEVFVEAFSPEGRRVTGINAGMRLHGFTGREGDFATKKSYRLHFRDRYGDGSLEYPLIPHAQPRFQRLVLRANNDDAFRRRYRATYVRDQLIRELHEEMGAIASHGAWYNLFINMRFKGVYNVVERIDGGFLRSHVRDGSTAWDLLHDGIASEGDSEAWDRLLVFLRAEDLRDSAAYEEAIRKLDVES
ncbi:MAG: CotH kinase family protein, partial [Vicinamibacteria bacterium]